MSKCGQRRHRDPHTELTQAYRTGDYALKAIAEQFGVHDAAVSRAVQAFEAEAS